MQRYIMMTIARQHTSDVHGRIERVRVLLLLFGIYTTIRLYFGRHSGVRLTVQVLQPSAEVLLEDIS